MVHTSNFSSHPADLASKPMTIGIAGATGLVGRHIVRMLAQEGRGRLVGTFNRRKPFDLPGVDWVKADLLSQDDAISALRSVDAAVMCAGRLSTTPVLRADPVGSVLDTLRIGINLLEAAARLRISRVILVSSCTGLSADAETGVDPDFFAGDPPDQWFGVGWTHRYLEKQLQWYAEKLGLIGSGIVLRPTLVYGPYDDFAADSGHFVPSFIRQVVARQDPIEVWGDGTQTRNLLHAADLASAVSRVVALEGPRFRTFNVAAPCNSSVNEVLRHLIELDGFSTARIVHDPSRPGGPPPPKVTAHALQTATGWQAEVGVREGLAGTLAWYRDRNDG